MVEQQQLWFSLARLSLLLFSTSNTLNDIRFWQRFCLVSILNDICFPRICDGYIFFGYIHFRYISYGYIHFGYIFYGYISYGYMKEGYIQNRYIQVYPFSLYPKKDISFWIYPKKDISFLDIYGYISYIHGYGYMRYIQLSISVSDISMDITDMDVSIMDISMDISKHRIYPWIYKRYIGYIQSEFYISMDISMSFFWIIREIANYFWYIHVDISHISDISMDISFGKRYIHGYIHGLMDISKIFWIYPNNSLLSRTLLAFSERLPFSYLEK